MDLLKKIPHGGAVIRTPDGDVMVEAYADKQRKKMKFMVNDEEMTKKKFNSRKVRKRKK